MNQGAKVLLGGLALVGIGLFVFSSGEKTANAASGAPPNPPLPPVVPPLAGLPTIPPNLGTIMVPPFGPPTAPPNAAPPVIAPPVIAPAPGGGTTVNTPVGPVTIPANGTTFTLPGIGTVDPATGNVFGPNGVIVGNFNKSTGTFTPASASFPPTVTLPNGETEGTGSLPSNAPPVPTQTLPGLTITPGPAPTPAEPPASPAEQPSSIPGDTLATITSMLAQEHSPHWRIIPEPTLKTWQSARGLTADGDYGTGTALRMGQETGMLPIVRGWPKGSYLGDGKLQAFQNALRSLAASAPEPRRSQLIAAAAREQGQGYGTPEKPITSLITLQDA